MLEFLKALFRLPTAARSSGEELVRQSVATRELAEQGLRRSEEPFEHLMAGVRDYAIFLLDRQGYVLTWNAGAERIKGYKADEIIGQHFASTRARRSSAAGRPRSCAGRRRTGASRTRAGACARTARSSGPTSSSPPCAARRCGPRLPQDHPRPDRAAPGRGERPAAAAGGGAKGAEAGAAEARRAQQEERRQREQPHVTLSSIGDAVIVTDARGAVTFLNPVAAGLTGWAPQDAAG